MTTPPPDAERQEAMETARKVAEWSNAPIEPLENIIGPGDVIDLARALLRTAESNTLRKWTAAIEGEPPLVELARRIIKQATHDPANVMMLGEVAPLAQAFLRTTTDRDAVIEALREINDIVSTQDNYGPGQMTLSERKRRMEEICIVVRTALKSPSDRDGGSAAGAGPFTKWRKKPVVIEAVQFCGEYPPSTVLPDWWSSAAHRGDIYRDGAPELEVLYIKTLEGTMSAQAGDWIIRDVKGELYPCKPDIFSATYEPVADVATEEQGSRNREEQP